MACTLLGMVSIYLSMLGTARTSQALWMAWISFGMVVGICGSAHISFLSSCKTGSVGLRSGEDGGCGNTEILWSASHCFANLLLKYYSQNSALKRCSRVETPQHRVLENTLNMAYYFTWIIMILFEARCKGVQTQHKPDARSQNDHVVNVAWGQTV